MSGTTISRRQFGQTALAVAALAGRGSAALAAADRSTIRLGAPVPSPGDDPEELARAHRKLGYRAAYCPPAELNDTDRIRAIAKAFAKHDVTIAEVGRWVNLLDADPAERKANLEKVTEGLALAEAIGARCCVDIAGSYSKQAWYGPHPENLSRKFFEAAVENARKIIDAVQPKRAKFCYEMMGWALPDSAAAYLEMIHAVDRPAFGCHLDPCNIVNSPRHFYANAALINQCFDQLGPWIVSCHAKDLTWDVEMNVHFREVTVGTGSIDYRTYLKRLAALGRDVPLMLEHCPNAEEYDRGRRYLLELGPKVGVRFSEGATQK